MMLVKKHEEKSSKVRKGMCFQTSIILLCFSHVFESNLRPPKLLLIFLFEGLMKFITAVWKAGMIALEGNLKSKYMK